MRDEIRRMGLFTSGVAELTRNRAEDLVKDLVHAGELGRDQAAGAVRELLERSRSNRRELLELIRTEIRHQVAALGLASTRDLERLERRVARLEGQVAGPGSGRKTSARKATRKTTAGGSARRKSSAGKTSSTGASRSSSRGPGGS